MSGLVRVQREVEESTDTINVMIYSDDRSRRDATKAAVGRRPGAGAPTIEWHEAATEFGVFDLIEKEDFAFVILDAETGKQGGMGIAHQLKDEVQNAPKVLLLIARQQDEWLARWARAEEIVAYPIEPRQMQAAVMRLLAEGK